MQSSIYPPVHLILKNKTLELSVPKKYQSFQAPFIYVNQIGLNDEILFDGQSFIANNDEVYSAESFIEQSLTYELTKNNEKQIINGQVASQK